MTARCFFLPRFLRFKLWSTSSPLHICQIVSEATFLSLHPFFFSNYKAYWSTNSSHIREQQNVPYKNLPCNNSWHFLFSMWCVAFYNILKYELLYIHIHFPIKCLTRTVSLYEVDQVNWHRMLITKSDIIWGPTVQLLRFSISCSSVFLLWSHTKLLENSEIHLRPEIRYFGHWINPPLLKPFSNISKSALAWTVFASYWGNGRKKDAY